MLAWALRGLATIGTGTLVVLIMVLVTLRVMSASEAMANSKTELLAYSPSTIALHTQHRKLVHQPRSVDLLSGMEEFLCFIQESRERWDDIAWKQIEEVKHKAVSPKKGEAEAEDVNASESHAKRYWPGWELTVAAAAQDVYSLSPGLSTDGSTSVTQARVGSVETATTTSSDSTTGHSTPRHFRLGFHMSRVRAYISGVKPPIPSLNSTPDADSPSCEHRPIMASAPSWHEAATPTCS
ncbi:hypothetical protein BC827DRAFT_1152796 [Russula dissimulans]|nr:hypothetical protein BC827DRAFT_1152796 [Russula dissimulans]